MTSLHPFFHVITLENETNISFVLFQVELEEKNQTRQTFQKGVRAFSFTKFDAKVSLISKDETELGNSLKASKIHTSGK